MKLRHLLLAPALLILAFAGCGEDEKTVIVEGPPGPAGPPGEANEPVTALEACVGCHGDGGVLPVADIETVGDAHFIDTDPDGPLTEAGYRDLVIDIASVDVSGTEAVIEFDVRDENGAGVPDVFAGDGRFTIAQLVPPAPGSGDASEWVPFLTRTEDPTPGVGTGDGSSETQATAEAFSRGTFENLGAGSYRYTSRFDPTSVPVLAGDTLRVAIQISAGDLPAGNGWCDFDASLAGASGCGTATRTRDIVQTSVCNGCHGVTPDTQLALHGGGRTDVEYCVTCHNPGTTDANSDNVLDFKQMIHKIHYGSQLAEPYQIWGFRDSLHDYSTVSFTKDIDDCTNCHTGGGADVENWHQVPTTQACGSCHDDVNFAAGTNHEGGQFLNNEDCTFCHVSDGDWPPDVGTFPVPVQATHRGVDRATEATRYEFIIVDTDYDPSSRELTVDYSVTQDGIPMDLVDDPEWTAGSASRLAVIVAWPTDDYTNEGTPSPPASALSVNALQVGGAATDLGGNVYRVTPTLPSEASGTVTVALEGHPASDLLDDLDPGFDDDFIERIPVKNVFEHVDIGGPRSVALPRRDVVAIEKCNACHDAAGQGLSLHGNNRTGEDQVCVMCHNANNTDINRRPGDPADAVDGKREETIDFKRLIHKIHAAAELEEGIVVYGFGGSVHDFSHVEFIGNIQNCETCHNQGTYGALQAGDTLPTTIDTGDDLADPGDDLNISPIAAVCSGCHDHEAALDHMKLHGAAFRVLDEDVH